MKQPQVVIGDDGLARCGWSAHDQEYRRYHDEEWGVPLHGDRPLFEKLSLEGFQAGLSWITILRRRPTLRAAFHDFDIDAVAALTETDVDALLQNTGIIRNRLKIRATISNARLTQKLVTENAGALDALLWSFAPPSQRALLQPHRAAQPSTTAGTPTITAESTAMSGALRALGFRFVGPTTLYALMQSTGMVNDHAEGCWRNSSDARDESRPN